jgi:hypothetical protein
MIHKNNIYLKIHANKIWKKLKPKGVDKEEFDKEQFYNFFNQINSWANIDVVMETINSDFKREIESLFKFGPAVVLSKANTKKGVCEYKQKHFRKNEINNMLCQVQDILKQYDDYNLIYNMSRLRPHWENNRKMYYNVLKKYNTGDIPNMDGDTEMTNTDGSMFTYDNGFIVFYNKFLDILNNTIEFLYLRLQFNILQTMYNKMEDDDRKSFTSFGICKISDDETKKLSVELNENKKLITQLITVEKAQRKKTIRKNTKKEVPHMTMEEYKAKYGNMQDVR